MNIFLPFRSIENTLNDYLNKNDLKELKSNIEKILNKKYDFLILKSENDTEWFLLFNSFNSRFWLTIFQDPYETKNRIIINEFLIAKDDDNQINREKIIDAFYKSFGHIGPISIYSNNSSIFWLEMGFILEENKIYMTYKK